MKKVKILNVQFDVCTKEEALSRVFDLLKDYGEEKTESSCGLRPRYLLGSAQLRPGKQIVTPNPEMLLVADKNPEFRAVLNKAWMSIPDGIGILWASTVQEISRRSSKFGRYVKGFWALVSLIFFPKLCRKVFSERVSGVDLMEAICAESRTHKTKIFLLGAGPRVADRASEVLKKKYPGVQIVGTYCCSPSPKDFNVISPIITSSKADVLFVAFGSPNQELWIARNLQYLDTIKIAMGVGGAFDFISGETKRAPAWMRKTGLEWMYRLAQQPSRIKRIWHAVVKFPLRLLNG
ncbi:MAG: WecB/TagA/CpsF family glycosyltransferase [Patescibacteria group bacterium]